MKKSKAETAETRKRIIDIASQEFKRKGIHATSVAEIMAAAGLTHGGFYRHFESKERLLAEACSTAMGRMAENAEIAVDGGEKAFTQYVDEFLTRAYHDNCAGACTFVTLGSELARVDDDIRHTMSEGFRTWIEILSKRSAGEDPEAARADAMFKLTAMLGAVTMARVMDDKKFADQILAETRLRLLGEPSDADKKKKKKKRASAATA